MSRMFMWETIKRGVDRMGKQVYLQRQPVLKSPSGRFVFEYRVVYVPSFKVISKGMSRQHARTVFAMETA